MSSSPQKGWANIFLVISVSLTLFLASNVFIQKLFGHLLAGPHVKMAIAGGVSVCFMTLLCLVTSLGRELLSPIRRPPPTLAAPQQTLEKPDA